MKAMSALTGLLYAALIAYLGGWYTGYWNGNFSLLLLILTTVTLAYWLAERFHFEPARRRAAVRLGESDAARRASLAAQGIQRVDGDVEGAREELLRQPWWLDWTAGLFPVILIVFLLRSFMFEPFKIPSGSMVPTLLIGDLILVNKYHYGIRLPVINKKIISNNDVQRGDVVVFRLPKDDSVDYIKRVIGLPGDRLQMIDGVLNINGEPVKRERISDFVTDEDGGGLKRIKRWRETLPNGVSYTTLDLVDNGFYDNTPVYTVPPGHFFMMGDNRDNSSDSRSWGFLPTDHVVGKVVDNFGGRIF